MTDPFIGEIRIVGFNFPPRGWAECDGQLLQISQHSALFSLLGTMYGGDGRTTFGLPDLRGRHALHEGSGPGLTTIRQGERGGSESNTLTVAQLPAHAHDVKPRCNDADGDQTDPGGNFPAESKSTKGSGKRVGGPVSSYSATGPAAMGTTTSESTGNGASVPNRSPYLGVKFVIALVGIFPSRN